MKPTPGPWRFSMKLVDNVTVLPVATTLDLDAKRVLTAALKAQLQGAIVLGADADGQLYFASSYADGGTVPWWMEKAKLSLMEAKQP